MEEYIVVIVEVSCMENSEENEASEDSEVEIINIEELKKEKEELEKERKKLEKERKRLEKERKRLEKEKKPKQQKRFWKKKKDKKIKILQEIEEEDLIEDIEKMSKKKINELSPGEIENFRKRCIAKRISEEFSYNEIKATIDDPKKSRGAAVYGYVLKNFKDGYELIKTDYIFDIACHYAKRKWLPTPQYLMKKIDLDMYIKTGLRFSRTYCFDHFADQPFNECIVYAPDTWLESVTWERRVKWYIDGWIARVNVGKSNVMILDWAVFDLPMLIILHSPGKDYGLYRTNFKNEDELELPDNIDDNTRIQMLNEQKRQLMNDIIVLRKSSKEQQRVIKKLRSKLVPLRHKNESVTERLGRMTEAASEFREMYNMLEPVTIEKEIKEIEDKIMEKETKTSKQSLIWVIVFILVVIILGSIFLPMLGGNGGIDPTNTTAVEPVELDSLLRILWLS